MQRKWIIPLMIALLFVGITAIIMRNRISLSVQTVTVASRVQAKLVIDAGHGGLDGGAVSADGSKESELNLSIAQKLSDLCSFSGIDFSMTRSSEALPYPPEAHSIHEKKLWDQKQRVAQVSSTEGAVLLSIHQNYFPDARPSGTQVLYAEADGSAEFAELTQENLRRNLCPENRRLAQPATDSIYLLKHADCPAILVECGFLSNEEEAERLATPSYQKKIAAILFASFLQFTG